ncbi:hypothetical protein [Micromonospora sp. CB01531]|uniref:hypothetical protein n=1 Tax=Micromonospora sp. CB01531 TaxID=1718947 RepID=UPI00093BE1F1|nr:hypothetical protein [Micromonospora sp. CB01531]OKI47320.1 hypothetical protein A6A27_10760 [Micromonospora sp. CB01531]
MKMMTRHLLAALALTAALLGAAIPAQAATRPGTTNDQLIAMHDCHSIASKPDPTRGIRGWLKDNAATPTVDLVYQASKGMQLGGTYLTTHFCYR